MYSFVLACPSPLSACVREVANKAPVLQRNRKGRQFYILYFIFQIIQLVKINSTIIVPQFLLCTCNFHIDYKDIFETAFQGKSPVYTVGGIFRSKYSLLGFFVNFYRSSEFASVNV